MYWELFGLALCTALFVLSLRHFSRSESSAAPLVPVPHAAAPQEPDSAVEDTAAFDSCGRELATESRRNEPENLLEGEAEDDETSAEGDSETTEEVLGYRDAVNELYKADTVTATEYQLLTIKLDNFFVSGSDDDFEALACLLYEVALDSQAIGIIERFRDSIPAYRQAQFSKIVDRPNNPAQQSPPPADTFAVLLRRIPCKDHPEQLEVTLQHLLDIWRESSLKTPAGRTRLMAYVNSILENQSESLYHLQRIMSDEGCTAKSRQLATSLMSEACPLIWG